MKSKLVLDSNMAVLLYLNIIEYKWIEWMILMSVLIKCGI